MTARLIFFVFFEKMRFHPLTAAHFYSIIVRVLSDYG